MNKEILAVLLVSLVVLISGCTMPWGEREEPTPTGVTQSPTDGVVIESFGVRDPYLMGGAKTIFSVRIRNVGGAVATIGSINAPFIEGNLTISNSCKGKTLNPPIPDKRKEGDVCEATWEYTAPEVLTEQDYKGEEFKATLKYNYTTKSKFIIPIYSQSKLNVLRREGKLPVKTPSTENSGAPIHFQYDGPAFFEAKNFSEPYTGIKLKILNRGSGMPDTDKFGRKSIPKIKITSTIDSKYAKILPKDCGNDKIILDYGYCTFGIKTDNTAIDDLPNKEINLVVTVEANYPYIIDRASSLTIRPK